MERIVITCYVLLIIFFIALAFTTGCAHPQPSKDDPKILWCRQLCGENGVLKYDALVRVCTCRK